MDRNRKKQALTTQEKRESELAKEMYLLIKTVNVIEKAYVVQEKITKEEYEELQQKNLTKYKRIKEQIPAFDLDNFINSFGMENCTWAKQILQKGLEKENQYNQILIQLTQKFITLFDIIEFNKSQMLVKDIITDYQELMTLLKKLDKKILNLQNLERINDQCIKNKKLNDCLSEIEKNEILEVVEQTQKEFGNVFGIGN